MNKKTSKELTKLGLSWHTHKEVFGHIEKNPEFQKEFDAELHRRRLARQIHDLRTSKHLTQQVVARKAGMPQSVIARIESGERGISVDTLGRVARALGKEIQLV